MKKLFIISFILINLIHFLAVIYDWYYTIYWIDVPLHILGGIWLSSLFLYFFEKNEGLKKILFEKPNIKKESLIFIILCLGFVALIGVLWEFYEFFVDVIILKKYAYNAEPGYILFDTLKDLFNDLVGGIIALIIYFKRSAPKNL
ncbi:MAG: hypothetical protein ACP5QN_00825 [Minisyncoccia bacterium]